MDDLFQKYIEVDSDIEKKADETTRRQKTTKDQFDLIVSFMEKNNEELLDKETFTLLWDDLAARLNNIGPPEHTVPEWKRIWSARKYNKNRKRATSLDIESCSKAPRIDQPSPSSQCLGVAEEEIGASNTFERIDIPSQLMVKLDVLISNQNVMIMKQDEIIQELKTLQEIEKKT